MNTLRKFAAAVTLLADSGMDPLAAATIIDLRDAIVARSTKVTLETDPAELVAIVGLIETLETLMDGLAEQHRAINSVADGVAA